MERQPIETQIEHRLADAEPDVELLLAEQVAPDKVRLVIDHPDGVDLALCERVTKRLSDLLIDYGLEVSSPGPQRPLTKPDHFQRFVGRRAREPVDGHKSFTGELVSASEDEVTVATDGGVVSIAHAHIKRGNLLED
jgi:ribosome maturation factor RimP